MDKTINKILAELSDYKERLINTSPNESQESRGVIASSVLIMTSSPATLGSKGNDNLMSYDEN